MGVHRRNHGLRIERGTYQVHPMVVQLDLKFTDSPPLIAQESFHIKGDLSFQHVIDSPR
jgi:hypothetical protein